MTDRPLKVLIAKPGLDGHDRGAKVLARGLRDEGFEVVYTGLRQTPEMIVTAALQEDVDVVGLSILSGAHMTLVPRVCAQLRERGLDDVLVTVGGIIPDDDVEPLRAAGVAGVFGPGTTIREVADFIRANATPRDRVTARTPPSAPRPSPTPPRAGDRRSPRPAADRRREPHARRGARPAPPVPAGGRRPPRGDHRSAGRRQVHAGRGAHRRAAHGGPERGGRRRGPVLADHRRSAAGRPRPDAVLRLGRRRLHPFDGVARPRRRARFHVRRRRRRVRCRRVRHRAARDRGHGPERGRGGRGRRHDRRARGARDGRRGPGDQGRACSRWRTSSSSTRATAQVPSGPRPSCGRCSCPSAAREVADDPYAARSPSAPRSWSPPPPPARASRSCWPPWTVTGRMASTARRGRLAGTAPAPRFARSLVERLLGRLGGARRRRRDGRGDRGRRRPRAGSLRGGGPPAGRPGHGEEQR